ncbi:MAG: lysozyme [bacterium]|nr:MAG: lysozyme [bacterium]
MKSALIFLSVFATHSMQPHDAASLKYKKFLIRQVRFYWGMEQEVSTFAAQIKQESNWNPSARSPYATGLTQFTPKTAGWILKAYPNLQRGVERGSDVRLDWKWAIRAMVQYDFHLYSRLANREIAGASRSYIWILTLRAYNGGIGWIYRELASCQNLDFDCCSRFRSKKACKENLEYPKKIITRWKPIYAGWDG